MNHAAAILFANREMPANYPQCLLRLARFRGTDKMEFIDSQRIYGNIFQQLDAAIAFLFKHLSLSGRIEGLEREERLSVPYKAVREGVLNSLAHRSYREAGGSVGIAIYDDRVEIEIPALFRMAGMWRRWRPSIVRNLKIQSSPMSFIKGNCWRIGDAVSA